MAQAGLLGAMEQLSERDKHHVLAQLNELQMNEFMTTYNNMVERCFNECVTNFRSKALETGEEQCIKNCVQKFMNFQQRVTIRFQEKQVQMAQKPM
mmetsp:Transcript_19930/g.45979  ORF Transcript_19930/g.45979 Transcript_19930/m.45979 type:complete len:96 (+) Transcript_19930:63-350(+)